MDLAQAFFLFCSIVCGVTLAVWFRPFAMIFLVPVLIAFYAAVLYGSGLRGSPLLWAVVSNWLGLQISYVLTALFVARFSPAFSRSRAAHHLKAPITRVTCSDQVTDTSESSFTAQG